jgi:hypothetical protein
MASSVSGLNSGGFFPVGTLEGARSYCHSQDIEVLVARLQAAVTTADANMLRCVR